MLSRMSVRALALISAVFLLVACSSGGDNGGGGGSSGSSGAPCDGNGETYSAGMSKLGQAGKLSFTLLDSKPAPPGVGDNVWTLGLADAGGASAAAANVVVKTWMPEHGHPGPTQAVVTEPEAGKYLLDPVTFNMPGLWEITIEATSAAGEADSALFKFCVGE